VAQQALRVMVELELFLLSLVLRLNMLVAVVVEHTMAAQQALVVVVVVEMLAQELQVHLHLVFLD
jgi:hypothetical protein